MYLVGGREAWPEWLVGHFPSSFHFGGAQSGDHQRHRAQTVPLAPTCRRCFGGLFSPQKWGRRLSSQHGPLPIVSSADLRQASKVTTKAALPGGAGLAFGNAAAAPPSPVTIRAVTEFRRFLLHIERAQDMGACTCESDARYDVLGMRPTLIDTLWDGGCSGRVPRRADVCRLLFMLHAATVPTMLLCACLAWLTSLVRTYG